MVMGPEEGYAWAVANDVAAMFVVYDGEDFIERMTPAFAEAAQVEVDTEA
jgi:thiamine biosynthesis lipoprotein ApbE